MKKLLIVSALAATAFGASNAELESRIEDLELSRDLNYWTFSGELETRYDAVQEGKNKNTTTYAALSAGGVGTADNSIESIKSWFRFNMEAKPSDRFSFFGRLSMAKYWNNFQEGADTPLASPTVDGGRKTDGPEVFVERAFFNYNMMKSLTLSMGRLPTIDGPSDHFTRGNSRSGSYPKLAYAAVLDGAALTHSAKVGGGSLATRFIYTPAMYKGLDEAYTKDTNIRYRQKNNMWSAMLDYENVTMPGMGRFNFIVQHINMPDLALYYASPSTGKNLSNVFFDYTSTVLYAEANGIAGSTFDFAVSYKKSTLDSRGDLDLTSLGKGNQGGILTSKEQEENKGNQMLINASYGFMSKFRLGYEYIKTDKDVFAIDFVGTNPINFYGTSDSKGHHAYLTTQVDNNLKFIVGYMKLEQKTYRASTILGDGTDVDITKSAGYLSVIASF